ncbi:MAG: translation initiation factor [Muribaculaceae bacterium]|nr:translation initiation factor [Muribaculaceae bacterium]
MNDWMNALGALRDSLPVGDDTTPADVEATAQQPSRPDFTLHVVRSTKGRAGKVATLVYGFPDDSDDDRRLVADTAASLRRALGTGGSQRDGEILIQGDRCRQVADLLRQMNFNVKLG